MGSRSSWLDREPLFRGWFRTLWSSRIWDPWEGERNGEEWSAVPTTLPTYVDAPRATRVRRPIERDRDWSGEAMVEVARTMRRPRITVDDLEDDRYELRSTPRDVASSEDTAELPSLGYEETRRAAGE